MKALNPQGGSLQGVRILDMATVLAGPAGATLCADHGADVVKLELPDGSDALRHMQPVWRASASITGLASWRTCMLASSGWPSDSTPGPSRNFCDTGSRLR